MPTYEYRCENGHEFEAFQKMSDPPVEKCPECGAAAERRISSGAGLVFKGSGFYITDYKNAGDSKRKSAEGKSEGSGSGDSGASGDSGTSKESKKSSGAKSSGKSGSGSSGSSSGSSGAGSGGGGGDD